MSQFPKFLIDPNKKDKSWILQMNKAVWSEHKNTAGNSFARGADRYKKNILYSLGKNSSAKYKKIFKTDEDSNTTFMNVNWDVLPILPKFRRIVVERIGKIKLTVEAQAIDAFALKDKKRYEAEEKANITMRGEVGAMGWNTSMFDSGEANQPQTMEELAMKMEFEYKHNMAIDVEKQVKTVMVENHIEEVMNEVVLELFNCGVGGVRDSTDKKTGRVKFRSVNAANLVVSPTRSQFFRDPTYIGELIYMTIDEVRRDASGEINEDQLEELASKNKGKYGNPTGWGDDTPYGKGYDTFRVAVLDLNFVTLNRQVFEKWTNKIGNPEIAKTKWKDQFKEKKGRETMNDDKLVWYESKWVVDSDILFDYTLAADQKRKPSRIWDAIPNFHLVAPELYDMETTAMAEQLIPIIDQILIAWYKLQNVIALAKPKGIAIEVGALEDISLGKAGEEWTPLQILDLFNQTGSIAWRRVDGDGNMTNYKPIEELQNGLGSEAADHFGVIDKYFSMMRDMLGFNDLTDGSTPDPRTLNGVANLADESTSNSIYHIARARRNIFERLADSIAVRVHDTIAFKETTVYDNILGAEGIKSIKQDKNKTHREYGIFVRDQDDPKEEERLNIDISEALKQKEISVADKIAIMGVDNLKQRGMLLAYRIKRRQEELQAAAEKDKLSNAKVQQDSARVAEEEKRKTLSEDMNAELAKIAAKGAEDRKTLAMKIDGEREIKTLDGKNKFHTETTKEGIKQMGNQEPPQEQDQLA